MLRHRLTIVNDSSSRGTKKVEIADKTSRKSPMTAAPMTHVRWLLILCLFVLSAVAYLDRVNLSIASAKLTSNSVSATFAWGLFLAPFYSVMRSFRRPQAGSPIALVPGVCSPLAFCGGVFLAP